jgi:hypothetical protein
MFVVSPPGIPLAAWLPLRLRLLNGGYAYALPTRYIFADEVMGVQTGAEVRLGFVRPYLPGTIQLYNLRGERGWFDLREVQLLRILGLSISQG